MKRILTLTFGLLSAVAFAQKNGAITESMLQQIKQQNPPTATDRALRNALAANGINDLTKRADKAPVDGNFTYRVPSNGITDQQSSGRCWLFTGLNVMRARMIKDYKLGEFTLSQSFLFVRWRHVQWRTRSRDEVWRCSGRSIPRELQC